MSKGFVSLEDAEVTSSLKVCCREMARLVKENIVKVKVGRLRTKSTIDGGPSYYEIYSVVLVKIEEDEEIMSCEFCNKSLTDKEVYIRIDYMEKKDGRGDG